MLITTFGAVNVQTASGAQSWFKSEVFWSLPVLAAVRLLKGLKKLGRDAILCGFFLYATALLVSALDMSTNSVALVTFFSMLLINSPWQKKHMIDTSHVSIFLYMCHHKQFRNEAAILPDSPTAWRCQQKSHAALWYWPRGRWCPDGDTQSHSKPDLKFEHQFWSVNFLNSYIIVRIASHYMLEWYKTKTKL